MNPGPRLAYAQARLQARFSRLPTAADWQRLSSARTLAAYLEEARVTGLVDWVRSFSGLSQAHELDRGCRALALDTAVHVADWSPKRWRAAIEWVAWLPWLSQLEHLARRETLPDWSTLDVRLRGLVGEDGALDTQAWEAHGLAALLAKTEASSASRDLGERWQAAWRERWPTCGGRCRRDLDGFSRLVQDHLDRFRGAPAASAWELREALRDRLRAYFHQHPVQPVALFAYLAIVFLDLERLRGALISRALFDGGHLDS
ncbi:hypothetical protein [Thiocapsa bogorovii]|uniref:hypothetical protein n=1 Tax=Thiocapsa bogorovii TaxID=521689 RepID=UPI001E3ED92B|nr:hypothetical protein [Thiocapsa bogorovii]UHD16916.1 hypothetical protein LT988_02310 [Thiocapsa bogorovii]